jgi:hypothetical protein
VQRRANLLRPMIPEIVLNGRQIIHSVLLNMFRKNWGSYIQIECRADADDWLVA